MARPSDYSPELATLICERIVSGESLRSVCESPDMPDKATVFRWLARHEAFRDQYARIGELRAFIMGEEIIEISDDGRNDTFKDDDGNEHTNHDVIARSRLRVDTRKWLMARMAPKKYGDKVTVAGDSENPVQTVTRIERVLVDAAPKLAPDQKDDSNSLADAIDPLAEED